MPRPHRRNAPGSIAHVTARGVNGCAIVRSHDDRRRFIALLADVVDRFDWLLLAYCLMGNHFHLLVETRWQTLSAGVQRLSSMHAQRFNREHGRYGHLFQGRFASEDVARDAHLLEAARYIVLNPARAGICRDPVQYPWSSFRTTVGLAAPGFVAVDALLPFFGPDEERARERYGTFVRDGTRTARSA